MKISKEELSKIVERYRKNKEKIIDMSKEYNIHPNNLSKRIKEYEKSIDVNLLIKKEKEKIKESQEKIKLLSLKSNTLCLDEINKIDDTAKQINKDIYLEKLNEITKVLNTVINMVKELTLP